MTLCDTVDHTCQAPLAMGFSRQEYWSGLPSPPPGDLPNPGIEPVSLMSSALQVDSLPLSHWGETVGTVSDYFGGLQNHADGDCSHEIKRRLLLGRKVMINLDSILKSRDITLPTKIHLVKAMVFPVVMYGCESWTVKKAEC